MEREKGGENINQRANKLVSGGREKKVTRRISNQFAKIRGSTFGVSGRKKREVVKEGPRGVTGGGQGNGLKHVRIIKKGPG